MSTNDIKRREEELRRMATGRLVEMYQQDYQSLVDDYNKSVPNLTSNWQSADALRDYNLRVNSLKHDARYLSDAQKYITDKNDKTSFSNHINATKNVLNNIGKNLSNISSYWSNWDSENTYKSSPTFYANTYNNALNDWDHYIEISRNMNGNTKHDAINYIIPDEKRALTGEVRPEGYVAKDNIFDSIIYNADISGSYSALKYMTENEVDTYNYIYAKEGEKAADKYLTTIQDILNAREGQQEYENIAKLPSGLKEAAMAAEIISNQVGNTILNYTDIFNDKARPYSPSDYITQHIFDSSEDSIAKDILKTTTDIGGNIINMAPAIITGNYAGALLGSATAGNVIGSSIMGFSAAGNSYNESLREGYSREKAYAYGITNGAMEAGLQYFLGGISALGGRVSKGIINKIGNTQVIKFLDNVSNGTAGALLKFGGNMASEGFEEYVQSVLDPVIRNITLDEHNDFGLKNFVSEEAIYSGIMGALTAGIFEAGNIVSSNKNITEVGKRYSGDINTVQGLIDYALILDPDTQAYKIAENITNGKASATDYNVGKLVTSINEYIEDTKKLSNSKRKKNQSKANTRLDSTLQGVAALQGINTNISQNEDTASIDTKTQIVDAITQELVNSGMSVDIAPQNAELVTKILSGENLTAKELRAAASDVDIKNVLKEHAGIEFSNTASADRKAISSYVDSVAVQKAENTSQTDANIKSGTTAATDPLMEAAEAQVAAQIHEPQNAVPNVGNRQSQTQKSTATPSAPAKSSVQTYGEAGKAGYETYKNEYSSEYSGQYYDDVFHMLYQAGKAGLSYKELKNFGDLLPKHIRKAAYDAGVADVAHIKAKQAEINTAIAEQKQVEKPVQGKPAEAASTENQKKKQPEKESTKQGTVKREYSKDANISEHTENQIQVIERVAEATGINFVVFESKTDENGNFIDENGRYDVESNTVYIEVHAGLKNVSESLHTALVNTASHELTHFIRQWSPAQYAKLQEFIANEFDVDFTEGKIKEITETYAKKGIELTYEQAMEELVANACNNMLLDSKAAIKLARQNMTLAKKIKSWIDEWTEKVRAAFTGDRRATAESMELLQKSKATLRKAQAIWDHALVEAVKNYNGSQEESSANNEKYSIRYTTDNEPVAVIDEDILKGIQKKDWIKTVKNIIKERFSTIPISGRFIKVNAISRNEITMSKNTQFYSKKNTTAYEDKFKSTGQLDEIVLASTNYINEDLKHQRKDNITQFARGDVLLRINEHDYSAKVIIGIDRSNSMILYDIIDFNPKVFELKKEGRSPDTQMQLNARTSSNPSIDNNLSQNDNVVNTQYMQNTKDDTTNPKKFSMRENNGIDTNDSKKYNEKGDYYGREQENGEPDNAEAGRDGRVSGSAQSKSDMELEKKISPMDRRENYRGIERSLKSKLETKNVSPVDLRYNPDAAKFADSIQLAKENNLHGAYVTQYSTEEYKNMSLFLSDEGNVGVALHDTEHGTDIVSVFKNPDAKVKKSVSSILLTAIQNGGNKLDNFDGKLSEMYAKHGFVPVARCAFNEEFAPTDWNYERDGKPDIIFWVHDGNNVESIVDRLNDRVLIDVDKIPLFDDYDAAGAYRDSLIDSLGENITEEGIYEAIQEIPITKENDQSTRFQLREEMERSDRELLADALSTIATSQQERDRLGAYKRAIKNLDDWQNQLTEVNRRLKELSFAKGKRDQEQINNLKAQKQDISRKLDWWDRRLLGLETEQPIRDLIARERNKSLDKFKAEIAKARAEGKQILSQKLLDQKAEYEARIKRDRERRIDTAERRKQREYIKKQVKKMNNLLIHETNIKHIPQALKKPVADFLSIFTDDDTGVFDYKKIDLLKSAYDKIGAGEYDNTVLSIYFDDGISVELENLKKSIDGRRLSELTIDELHSVKNIVDHFKYIIKTENELFVNGKKVDYIKYGNRAMRELASKGPKYNNALVAKSKMLTEFKNLITNKNITPTYFFKNIGGVIQELYKNIESGQYKWATNIYGSREFYMNTAERFHIKDWTNVKNDTIEFTSERGKKINLTRRQALSIYALSKRKQGLLHLKGGGIVIENDLKAEKKKGKIINYTYKQNDTVQLSDQDITRINSWLTKEQKLFADEMVRYLSQDMAALGNEVSMALYGYEKFGEDYYFPIISSDNYLYSKQGQVLDPRLKNQSYTKQTVENANNPVVVEDFIEIWGDHVNRMELYNALAVPLETFNRIYNFKDVVEEGKNAKSIKALLKNAYGEEAASYIDNLMKDINGGVRGDSAESWQNSWVNKFKKTAVFASMSVLIQQPSAIGRAMALVDPKYFVASALDQVKQKNTYAELKQYAPVAIIKEMGRFDTGTGASTVNWLTSFTYDNMTEKSAAFFKDSDYRDEVLSKGPSKADEITWNHIWEAVKRETADKTGLSITSEELLQKAGERFTEVVNLTQVYDSVFSRSELMRSKSGMVKMLTAFMSEPTLSYNMLYDAAKQAKTGGQAGKKYCARAIGAVAFSVVLSSILKSIITAARDDDEDKTYTEKYLGATVENIISDLNPLSLIPWVKDALSIFDGYSVERSDMSLIADLYEAITKLDSDSISAWEKQERFIGAIAALFGVPYRNISRDIRSLRNVIVDWTDDLNTTRAGIKYSIMDAINDSSWLASNIFDLDTGSNSDKLYHAIAEGDEDSIKRYESIIGKDKLKSNIRKGLRDNSDLVMEAALLAIEGKFVDYSDVFDQIEAQGFDRNDIISAINSVENMVGKAAKAKRQGDEDEYEKAVDNMRDIGMTDKEIEMATNKYIVPETTSTTETETYESVYSGKQLAYAVEDGNANDTKIIIEDLSKEYAEKLGAKGKKEREIKQGTAAALKSTLTSYFKPLYQQCYKNKDYSGMQKIRDKLNALRAYGIQYRGEDYADWIKSLAREKK